MTERLPARAAIERIRTHVERHELILGVDGFEAAPGGYIASLELILDLSAKLLSVEDAAMQPMMLRLRSRPEQDSLSTHCGH